MGIDPISAGIIGVTTLGSALLGSGAASDAANAQVTAANQAAQTQRDIFNQQVALQEPFRQAGITGQNKLLELLGLGGNAQATDYGMYAPGKNFGPADLAAGLDPGYQFRLDQGMKALNASMAARGLGISGANIKGAQEYGQNLASQEYQNAFNRYQVNRANALNPLQSLSGGAQTSANVLTGAAGTLGQQLGENALQAGNARASGYIGSSNAISNALGQGINAYFGYQNMNNMNQLLGGGIGSGGGVPAYISTPTLPTMATPYYGGSGVYPGAGG